MSANSANTRVAVTFMSLTSKGTGLSAMSLFRTCVARVERRRSEHPQAEFFVRDARRARRHRDERMAGHARRCVHLQQERLAVAGADHQVGTAPATATELV